MSGRATVLRADARNLPLPDASVDLIISSPPYFALRSYADGGAHYPGQIGDEATPAEFLEALWECTAEWQRVLKPSGSLFVNLGDKYAERTGPPREGGADDDPNVKRRAYRPARGRRDVRAKSLMGLPWRYALGCVDGEAGDPWILRAEVVWSKPNAMPESVSDRVRRSHEQWFHLTTRDRYYAAIDELREPSRPDHHRNVVPARTHAPGQPEVLMDRTQRNPAGRLPGSVWEITSEPPGSVWEITSEPLNVPAAILAARGLDDHFAAFPQEWPRRFVLGWSPPGICCACGEGRRPVVDVAQVPTRAAGSTGRPKRQDVDGTHDGGWDGVGYPQTASSATIVGYACACTPHTDHPATVGPRREWHLAGWTPPPTRPAVVLDPFGGTGTVAGVARALGRHGISVDLSHGYSRLARWRIFESGNFAKTSARTWAERQGELFGSLA